MSLHAGIIQALANQSFGDTIFNGFPASRQDFRQDRADNGAVTRQEVTLIEANTALLINRTEQLQRQADENQSAIKAAIARINALTPVRRAYVMSILKLLLLMHVKSQTSSS